MTIRKYTQVNCAYFDTSYALRRGSSLLLSILLLFFSCGGSDTPEPIPTPTPTENIAPTARGSVNQNYGEIGDTFIYNANGSTDPENKAMTYSVDVDGDGTYDTPYISTNSNTNYVYTNGGNMNPKIQVKDDKGLTSTYSLGKVGVLDPANNPINVELQVPKYIVADEEIKATVDATDANSRPLVYSVDWGINSGNIVDSNNKEHSKTYSENNVGKKNLEGIAMNDYAVQNNTTKEVEIGSPIPSYATVTDAIDGEKYKVDEIDQIGERVMTLSGVEHKFRVATSEEWNNLANAYGSSADLKYKEFSNGENVGATNESGFSGMTSGAIDNSSEGVYQGDRGFFMTLEDNASGSKVAYMIDRENINIGRLNGFPEGTRTPIRLIKID
jgi:PKD domain